jgi:hypothetical protein
LARLRRAGLIKLKGRSLTIIDPMGLLAVCDFDPNYLHLQEAETAAE